MIYTDIYIHQCRTRIRYRNTQTRARRSRWRARMGAGAGSEGDAASPEAGRGSGGEVYIQTGYIYIYRHANAAAAQYSARGRVRAPCARARRLREESVFGRFWPSSDPVPEGLRTWTASADAAPSSDGGCLRTRAGSLRTTVRRAAVFGQLAHCGGRRTYIHIYGRDILPWAYMCVWMCTSYTIASLALVGRWRWLQRRVARAKGATGGQVTTDAGIAGGVGRAETRGHGRVAVAKTRPLQRRADRGERA